MRGIAKGSIRCNKCGVSMKEGVCPLCGRAQCHINLYFQGRVYKFYKDQRDVILSHMSAINMLQEINREMKDKSRPFYIDKWVNASCKQRKMDKAIDLWIEDCKEQVKRGEMSLSVPILYRSMAKKHFQNESYGLSKWFITDIGVFELKQFSKALPDSLKISSRRAIMANLHAFFTWAHKEGLIREIPAFPTIKGNDSRPRVALTIEDQHEAFKKIPEIHRDVYYFESETGCRPGETCALKIKDFDFKSRTVTIRRTFTMAQLRESDKEGHKKPIPLSDAAYEIALKRAGHRFPEDWLFVNPKGRHYTVENLAEIWDRHSETGVTHYEAVRHSFATQITEHADVKSAQGLLRHVCKSSTERYVHHRVEYLRSALDKRTNVIELKKKEEK